MDSVEEDVSTRVLLRNVLQTELPRSPVTRSTSRDQQASGLRRSSRGMRTGGLQTPQLALRHKLKQKLHENSTHSPLPPSKRRKSQGGKAKTPAVAAPVLDDTDITPRGLLRGFLQTEADASLLLSGQPALPEAHLPPGETCIHSNRQSDGGSRLDLPDLATEPLSHVIRGMSRRRPPPTFSVSAFEKQLDHQSGGEEEQYESMEVTQEQDFSTGSQSVLSLTLKTPFVSVPERAGLQRKAAQRKKPSVNEFDEAVEKRLERRYNHDYTVVQAGTTANQSLPDFTIGLSSVAMSNTELYEQLACSASEQREENHFAPEIVCEEGLAGEGKGHVDKENEVVVDDKHAEHLSGTSRNEPELLQEMESSTPAPQPQGEEEEESVPPSLEKCAASLSPDEVTLAPTQPMAEPVSQSQEKEAESEAEHTEVESLDWRGSVKEDLPSRPSEQITRRAYRSEGGVVLLPEVAASGRRTKSVGTGLHPTESELQSIMGGSPAEAPASEDPRPGCSSPASPHTQTPPYPATSQTSLAEVEDKEGGGVTEGNVSQSKITDGDEKQSEDVGVTSPAQFSLVLHSTDVKEEEELDVGEEEEQDVGEEEEEDVGEEEEEDVGGEEEQDVGGEEEQDVGAEEEQGVEEEQEVGEEEQDVGEEEQGVGEEEQGEVEEEEQDVGAEEEQGVEEEEEQDVGEEEQGEVEEEEQDVGAEEQDVGEEEEQDVGAEEEQDVGAEEEQDVGAEALDVGAEALDIGGEEQDVGGEEEQDDEEATQSDELSMQTPAFIRQRKEVASSSALTPATAFTPLEPGPARGGAKSQARRKHRTAMDNVLPKSYVMSVFKHFAKTRVSSDVYPVINEILQKYFSRLADDLEVYSAHAKRRTIEVEDVELLMKRQGFVTDSTPLNVLIEKFLPMEYRKLLIPVATSGNKVIPSQRR